MARLVATTPSALGLRRLSGFAAAAPSLLTLPDLSDGEARYVKEQVETILRPKCLSHLTGNALVSSYVDGGGPLVRATERDVFERMFPPTKNFDALKQCIDILRGSYPGFQIPKSCHRSFKTNFRFPLVAERVVTGLKCFGAHERDLDNDTWLVHGSLIELPMLANIVEAGEREFRLGHIRVQMAKASLRGRVFVNRIRQVESSLKALGLEDIAENLLKKCLSRFDGARSTTISEVDQFCSNLLLSDLCGRGVLPPDKATFEKNTNDAQSIARNLYLLKNILDIDRFVPDTSSRQLFILHILLKSKPLENLITLCTHHEVMNDLGQEPMDEADFIACFSQHLGTRMQLSAGTPKFPVTLKAIYLMNIGFSPKECLDIILSGKAQTMKSCTTWDSLQAHIMSGSFDEEEAKQLETDGGRILKLKYSHPAYLHELRQRLEVLRSDHYNAELGIADAPKHFETIKANLIKRVDREAAWPSHQKGRLSIIRS